MLEADLDLVSEWQNNFGKSQKKKLIFFLNVVGTLDYKKEKKTVKNVKMYEYKGWYTLMKQQLNNPLFG